MIQGLLIAFSGVKISKKNPARHPVVMFWYTAALNPFVTCTLQRMRVIQHAIKQLPASPWLSCVALVHFLYQVFAAVTICNLERTYKSISILYDTSF